MSIATSPPRVLYLEDEPANTEVMERLLRKAGIAAASMRVDTRDDFLRALEEFRPDVVLADYRLPGFNGAEALQLLRTHHPDIPLIVVTGILGDEAAIELLKAGAKDYVLKDNLARLAPSVQRVLSMEQGIRARKAAERALRESEARLRALTEHSSDLTTIIAPDGTIRFDSPSITRLLGYAAGELLGRNAFELVHPDDHETTRAALAAVVGAPGVVRTVEHRLRHKQHGWRVYETKGKFLPDVPGIQGLVINARDITERQRAAETLRASRDLLRTIVENIPIRVFWKDAESRYLGGNALFARDVGLSNPEELLGKDDFQMGWRDQAELYRADDQRVMDSDAPKLGFEEPQTTPDGRPIWLRTSKVPLHDAGGNVFGVLGIYEDITVRKQMEEALWRSNRALMVLSTCNVALIHAASEPELLKEVCRVIVQVGGYRFAWVGYAAPDVTGVIRPVAGLEDGSVEPLGPALEAGALAGNQPLIVHNIRADPRHASWREQAIQGGYESFVALPLWRERGLLLGALCIYSAEPSAFDEEEVRLLAELADDLAFGIVTLRTRIEHERLQAEHLKTAERLKESLTDTIRAIALTVEKRDPYTAGHQNKVAELCVAIGRELGLTEDRLEGLRLGAAIHDIGKIYVPAEILNRPGRLTTPEFEIIKSHPQVGYDIIKDVKFPWPVASMILQHHERLDGSGYPNGLKGEGLVLEARILAVADVVEAMSAHRPYRPAVGLEQALAEIERHRGDHYDPAVADACVRLIREKGFQFR